jgi:hypothetical protein
MIIKAAFHIVPPPAPPSTPPVSPRATGSHPQPRQSASWAALQAVSRPPDDGSERRGSNVWDCFNPMAHAYTL